MSAITISVLSHGLISSTVTPPNPYDVRFGVDNGAGFPGTLTSPATGDVRIGVEYGGDGDQYTGTLVVSCPVPTLPESWTEDMGDTFDDLVTEFGDVLQYNSQQIVCVKTNLDVAFEMDGVASIDAGGEDDGAAAIVRCRIDCGVNRGRVNGDAVTLCAECADVIVKRFP